MEWIDADDELPLDTNLVNILTEDLSPYLGYLDEDDKWYVNCPCCEKCEIEDVRYWGKFDGLD